MDDLTPATNQRQRLLNEIKFKLGAPRVRLELAQDQFDFAITAAVDRYRMRSGNSTEESFVIMDLQPDVQVYTMAQEVQEVLSIYRRTVGNGGGGSQVDPFSLAAINNIYMLQNPSGLGGGGTGTLALYELAMDYQKLVGRMFGGDIAFTWNTASKRLFLERKFQAVETVLIHVFNSKPDEMLFMDTYSKPWIRDYATAECKMMLSRIRGKFSSGLGGPNGNISLDGDALKSEAEADFTRLEEEIKLGVDAGYGYSFVIG